MSRIAATIALLILSACAADPPADQADNAEAAAVGETPAVAEPTPIANAAVASSDGFGGATVDGDGSQIMLAALSPQDIETTKLPGELACSFAAEDGATLMIAKGDVASKDAAQGIIKVTGYVEPIAAPGGFDAMVKGATFTGKGKTVNVVLTGTATGGGESPPSPATLTYDRADGAARTIAGRWSCGP